MKQKLVTKTTKAYEHDWPEFKDLTKEVLNKSGDERLRELVQAELKKLRRLKKKLDEQCGT